MHAQSHVKEQREKGDRGQLNLLAHRNHHRLRPRCGQTPTPSTSSRLSRNKHANMENDAAAAITRGLSGRVSFSRHSSISPTALGGSRDHRRPTSSIFHDSTTTATIDIDPSRTNSASPTSSPTAPTPSWTSTTRCSGLIAYASSIAKSFFVFNFFNQ